MKKMSTRMTGLMCSLALAILIQTGCSPKNTPTTVLTPVAVQLRWTHQAQSAGFYMADQNGYYAEEGLKVSFIEGSASTDFIAPVLDGTAQFGITNPESLITARAAGKPVCAIAAIFRRNPAVLISLAKSGITRPQDLAGKIIQIGPAGVPRLHALLSKFGIEPGQYTVQNPTSDLEALYSGLVDVRGGNLTNEVITAEAAGYKINLIFYDDYGIHFFADTIFTTDELIQNDPDLVLRFLRATLKGWTYAVENPQEVGAMVLKYNPKADGSLENQKMVTSLPLINTGEDEIGWMKATEWAAVEKILRENDVITQPVDVSDLYTMQFLKAIYGK